MSERYSPRAPHKYINLGLVANLASVGVLRAQIPTRWEAELEDAGLRDSEIAAHALCLNATA